MFGIKEPFDLPSFVVVLLTFILFVMALFVKGFTHDLLLEAGVFLVSVKLIMMSSKTAGIAKSTEGKLDAILISLQHPKGANSDKLGV
ncbi:MAG: hypothetical protein JRF64_01110 [Deltaproteobacteria bacterium]|nr:hypothetical protein [Deltaproteobacteria bacterium]MBW2566642.1 hypothetical protein [Deltaproteobacteria bacterium]